MQFLSLELRLKVLLQLDLIDNALLFDCLHLLLELCSFILGLIDVILDASLLLLLLPHLLIERLNLF